MNRDDWKAFHSALRLRWRGMASKPEALAAMFSHAGTYWKLVRHRSAMTGQFVTDIQPRIIRDRSPMSRAAEALAWARKYRRDTRLAYLGALPKRGARASINEAREILEERSAFNALPA